MNKKLLIIYFGAMLFCTSNIMAQFNEISGKELESTIYLNHQKGLPSNNGLFSSLLFNVRDFTLLSSSFTAINTKLTQRFPVDVFRLDYENQQLVVVYDKTKSTTDDFLKLFKETLMEYGVFLVGYQESTLIKSQE